MGDQKLVDKIIHPLGGVSALQGLTWAQAQAAFNGIFLIGKYKGAPASLDITTLVEPLVLAEQLHILGILNGREEDYDLQTVSIPVGAAANAIVNGSLTVPSGEVWFVNAVRMTLPADAGGSPTANWHCSLWADRAATPSSFGQPFHAAGINFTPGGGVQDDEFCHPANWWGVTNKPWMLRLPAGTVVTMVVVNAGAIATAQMDCTLQLFGYIGKLLVP